MFVFLLRRRPVLSGDPWGLAHGGHAPLPARRRLSSPAPRRAIDPRPFMRTDAPGSAAMQARPTRSRRRGGERRFGSEAVDREGVAADATGEIGP